MSKLHKAQTQQGHSKHFFEYIRNIGEAKAKQEEDKIITKDLIDLKTTMAEKNLEGKKQKEAVVRMFYAEMLGQNAEFGHIQAVNLVPSPILSYKRTGYLATWLCVNPDHEFMYLIVSNLQRDMNSNSFLEVSTALTAASKLIKPDLMSAINGAVAKLLTDHPNALVRKKAVLCMHSFYRKSDGLIGDNATFRKALCDRDPSVMGAALCLFHEVVIQEPEANRDLLPSFISILKQITEHRLAREFDYHRVPAPWLQIKAMKILAILAADDEQLAQKCTDTLIEVMKRADTGLNIGYAVIFEAINTITSIATVPQLVEAAAEATSKFLTTTNANMKYLGITALSRIVKIDRRYAQEHQHIVMDCLEDSDETIRRKTLTLLFAMCSESNVEAIIARLIKFLGDATDQFLRRELVTNICSIADDLAPDNQWYIETMNQVLELGAEFVPQAAIQGMLKIIAEGDGEDEAEDAELRIECVEGYFLLMENVEKSFPNELYQVAAWVIGEYGFLTKKISRSMLIDRLCDMMERNQDADTRSWILLSVMKLTAQSGSGMPLNVLDVVEKMKDSRSVGLQQRCYEFIELSKMAPVLKKALPVDGCCEEIEVDESMSFLDGIVQDALDAGARPYTSRDVRLGKEEDGGLKTEAYKTARADVVDEEDLDKDKFNDEAETLIIRDGARRWGAKNLDEEAAVEKPIDTIQESGEPVVDGATGEEGASHADPMAGIPDGPRKPTKKDKFMNDLFGSSDAAPSGRRRKDRKRGGARAQMAAQMAAEAEDATAGMTSETAPIHQAPTEAPVVSSNGTPAAVANAAAAGGKPAEVQTNIQKQLGPDCLRVRFGVMGSAEISSVRISFKPPPSCDFASIKCGVKGSEVKDTLVEIPKVPAGSPAFVELTIKATGWLQGGGLIGEVSYGSAGGPGSTTGRLPLNITDLLRPPTIATDAFGQQWGKLSGEAKCQLKFPAAVTPDVLGKHLQERGQVKIIQVIKAECIAATQIVPGGPLILVHMSISGQTVNTTVRCANKSFSEAIAGSLQQGL